MWTETGDRENITTDMEITVESWWMLWGLLQK